MHNPFVHVLDGLSPEDVAMLQALYSRSGASVIEHLEKVKRTGSGRFMEQYYVGYNHRSIGDCGTTTVFFENVSLLAAKAIQATPLYSGQETSTRYLDMSKRALVDPVETPESQAILHAWMQFYADNLPAVAEHVQAQHPIRDGEDPKAYAGAVKARAFDIMRGFLPAGITTQLSWHTNLRQARDHLDGLVRHPASEIQKLAVCAESQLNCQYPSSGFGERKPDPARDAWLDAVAADWTYQPPLDGDLDPIEDVDDVYFNADRLLPHFVHRHRDLINTRPRNAVLPHWMTDFGQLHWKFLLDFGSFRDIQRHRNGVCRMPLLTMGWGFESWYLDQLPDTLREQAQVLISGLEPKIRNVTTDAIARQYLIPLGYRVQTSVTYALPAAVYVMELRSGKMIHPTLRQKIHGMIKRFQEVFPGFPLHVDLDPSDWDVRRGTQTITEKP